VFRPRCLAALFRANLRSHGIRPPRPLQMVGRLSLNTLTSLPAASLIGNIGDIQPLTDFLTPGINHVIADL